MKDKKLYIDVGDLVEWNGSFTGIQRVVFNVTKELISLHSSVTVCAYDDQVNQFYNVDFNEIISKFSETPSKKQEVEKVTEIIDNISLLRKSYLKTRHYLYLSTPPAITRSAKKIKIKHQAKNTQNAQGATNKPEDSRQHEYITLESGSVLIVPGIHFDHDEKRKMYDSLISHKIKIATVVYDLIPVLNDMYFSSEFREVFRNYLSTLIKYSELIFAISENTKKDLIKYAKDNLNKDVSNNTYVIRLGDTINSENGSLKGSSNILPEEPFILAVSTVEVRKNYILLYYAYKLLLSQGYKPPKLIIIGKTGWLAGDITHAINNDSETRDYIRVMHGISDKELDMLYKNCEFTVYASIYEGWGLPVAESMMYGKLCLASNTSSIVEVAGDYSDYFNPFDTAELARLIRLYSSDKKLLKAKNEKIKSFKETTWKTTSKQILSYLS